MRLNKILSEYGICSRRQADRYIEEGRVSVNGQTAQHGMQADPEKDIILIDGKGLGEKPETVILAYNKPAGVVCSTVSQGKEVNDIISVLGLKMHLYPVGRLDRESTGLILLTNDGDLTDSLLRSANGHEKEYTVKINGDFSDDELSRIRKGGIPLLENRKTKPCRIKRTGNGEYDIVLTEGMNRQIRRLCALFEKEVISLHRIRFLSVELNGLKTGEYRILSEEEKNGLYGGI
ncbi:MAG: rRNA pseudouridine synthase [Lachnospiraceae bacterium]|nr:rRNA pseudouridine synthase [Lachnospiraceae bacterium]